jgi:hypothetical protein
MIHWEARCRYQYRDGWGRASVRGSEVSEESENSELSEESKGRTRWLPSLPSLFSLPSLPSLFSLHSLLSLEHSAPSTVQCEHECSRSAVWRQLTLLCGGWYTHGVASCADSSSELRPPSQQAVACRRFPGKSAEIRSPEQPNGDGFSCGRRTGAPRGARAIETGSRATGTPNCAGATQ